MLFFSTRLFRNYEVPKFETGCAGAVKYEDDAHIVFMLLIYRFVFILSCIKATHCKKSIKVDCVMLQQNNGDPCVGSRAVRIEPTAFLARGQKRCTESECKLFC